MDYQDRYKKLEELVEGLSYGQAKMLLENFVRDVLPANCIASSERKVVL